MADYKYRALNPRNDDINRYFKLVCGLSDFCNDNKSVDENIIKWTRVRMGAVELVNPAYKNKPAPEKAEDILKDIRALLQAQAEPKVEDKE